MCASFTPVVINSLKTLIIIVHVSMGWDGTWVPGVTSNDKPVWPFPILRSLL